MILALETEPKSLTNISSASRLFFMGWEVDSKIESARLERFLSKDIFLNLDFVFASALTLAFLVFASLLAFNSLSQDARHK